MHLKRFFVYKMTFAAFFLIISVTVNAQENSCDNFFKEKRNLVRINWQEPSVKEYFNSFLNSLFTLSVLWPESIYPYNLNKNKISFIDFYKLTCKSSNKMLCKAGNDVKKNVRLFWNKLKDDDLLIKPNLDLSNHNRKISELRHHYKNSQSSYYSLLESFFTNDFLGVATKEDVNQILGNIRETSENMRIRYQNAYLSLNSDPKNIIFYTSAFIRLIEGETLALERSDVLRALKEVVHNLSTYVYLDLVVLTLRSEVSQSFLDEQESKTCVMSHKIKDFNKKFHPQVWSEVNGKNKSSTVAQQVNHRLVVSFLKRYSVNNALVIDHLLRRQYQRAIWVLKDLNYFTKARQLEDSLLNEVFVPENLSSFRNFAKGFTSTFVAEFTPGVRGLYKPSLNKFKHPLEAIASSYKKEIAAYEMDKLIDLRMVPLTIKIALDKYKKGSLQYFVEGADRARDYTSFNGSLPTKFSSAYGRNKKPSDMLFFDWLTSNYDRNIDNYMYFSNGRTVLIDHGFSFLDLRSRLPTGRSLKKIIPSQRVLKRVSNLHSEPQVLKETLGNLLSKSQLRVIVRKIKKFVKAYLN